MNEDLGNHSKNQLYCLMHRLEHLPNSERDNAKNHQFRKKVLPRIFFFGYALIAGGIWEEDILSDCLF